MPKKKPVQNAIEFDILNKCLSIVQFHLISFNPLNYTNSFSFTIFFLFCIFSLHSGVHSQNLDGEDFSSSSFSSASRASMDQPDCHPSSSSPSTSGSGENILAYCGDSSSSSEK